MAHFKRGKCRNCCSRAIRGSQASWRARHGFKPVRITRSDYDREDWHRLWEPRHLDQMGSYPAWWDRTFHTRKKRAATRALERKVLAGVDPDDVAWPLSSNKPHIYYW
jgi:hypothetical protein